MNTLNWVRIILTPLSFLAGLGTGPLLVFGVSNLIELDFQKYYNYLTFVAAVSSPISATTLAVCMAPNYKHLVGFASAFLVPLGLVIIRLNVKNFLYDSGPWYFDPLWGFAVGSILIVIYLFNNKSTIN